MVSFSIQSDHLKQVKISETARWDLVKGDRDRLTKVTITVIKGLAKKYRVGWAEAERGQFSATHGGWVILVFKRNRHTFICSSTGETSLEKEGNIQAFSEKYAVDQDLGVKYMQHLAYFNMMKQKRERARRE